MMKKTTRRIKRAGSPTLASNTTPANTLAQIPPLTDTEPVQVSAEIEPELSSKPGSESLEKTMVNFFAAESAAVSLSKPWLRLERGIRLQKYRAFAEAYPGLLPQEKDTLYKVLLKANDAKLLNTKTQIQYEHGNILSVKGLKMTRSGAGAGVGTGVGQGAGQGASFKIESVRSTKKNTDETK